MLMKILSSEEYSSVQEAVRNKIELAIKVIEEKEFTTRALYETGKSENGKYIILLLIYGNCISRFTVEFFIYMYDTKYVRWLHRNNVILRNVIKLFFIIACGRS